ncbi:hypothetical protein C8J56DRAFT_970749 [Mycena floridula]|nr:hypothetical protein C8J56DRAFT_970749 [Mycena floridula]
MALEIQTERTKVVDAMKARDAAVQRLSEACLSIQQKTALIERLQKDLVCSQIPRRSSPALVLTESNKLKEEVAALEGLVKNLREEIRVLKENEKSAQQRGPLPRYDENGIDNGLRGARLLAPDPSIGVDSRLRTVDDKVVRSALGQPDMSADDIINARNRILAMIPVPPDYPDDPLQPIMIPAPFTLHEFLGSASGSLRASLTDYRVLQETSTYWCPEREEHGYFLTPVFKCNTNPRVATAHRWASVDDMARFGKPVECFFNKDGKCYYAGMYQGFRLEDLTTKEWEALSTETTSSIIKDTINGRKNSSPQNFYEVGQLYSAGALKVACIGLQCVGFNMAMYRTILEQAAKYASKANPNSEEYGTNKANEFSSKDNEQYSNKEYPTLRETVKYTGKAKALDSSGTWNTRDITDNMTTLTIGHSGNKNSNPRAKK